MKRRVCGDPGPHCQRGSKARTRRARQWGDATSAGRLLVEVEAKSTLGGKIQNGVASFCLRSRNPIRGWKLLRASARHVRAVMLLDPDFICILRVKFDGVAVILLPVAYFLFVLKLRFSRTAAMTKDPNKPRGKTSAYAFFVATCREEHKKKHPGTSVNFAEFSKKCSERWKTMSAKEKVKFDEMAKNDKVRYDREMKSYVPPKGAKKGKKKKDPNAPKRPPSAFFVFCSDHRPRIKEENPGISIGDIAKKLGELWATQSSKDKAPYEAKAAKLKEKYEKDVAAYRAKGGSGKSDAGKKSGPGRPPAKKVVPADDDDDDDEDEDEEDDEDEDDDDDE